MPSYKHALTTLLLLASQSSKPGAEAFTSLSSQSRPSLNLQQITKNKNIDTQRAASIPASFNDDLPEAASVNKAMSSLGDTVRTVKVAYIDDEDLDEFDLDTASSKKANRKKRVVISVQQNGMQTFTYKVELPIVKGAAKDAQLTGLSLKEVNGGIISENSLEIDFLRYVTNEQEVIRRQRAKEQFSSGEEGSEGSVQILNENEVPENIRNGIIVSSVVRGGVAWDLGVRAGDMLAATSATIGDVSFE